MNLDKYLYEESTSYIPDVVEYLKHVQLGASYGSSEAAEPITS